MRKNELQWLLGILIYEAKELSLLSAPQRPSGAYRHATSRPHGSAGFCKQQNSVSELQTVAGCFAEVSPSKEKTMTTANALCKIKFKKKVSRNSQIVVT